MRHSQKKQMSLLIATLLIILITVIVIIVSNKKPNYIINIDAEQVSYITVFYGSLQKKIMMKDKSDTIRSLVEALNGSYSYYDKWRLPKTSGGGPCGITFFGIDRKEICQVNVLYNLLYVNTNRGDTLYRYYKDNGELDITFFIKEVFPNW